MNAIMLTEIPTEYDDFPNSEVPTASENLNEDESSTGNLNPNGNEAEETRPGFTESNLWPFGLITSNVYVYR